MLAFAVRPNLASFLTQFIMDLPEILDEIYTDIDLSPKLNDFLLVHLRHELFGLKVLLVRRFEQSLLSWILLKCTFGRTDPFIIDEPPTGFYSLGRTILNQIEGIPPNVKHLKFP